MPLTDTAIRSAKPYKIGDSQGLYLLINPVGSKLWRVKYRMRGIERKLAVGAYPDVSLAEARAARDTARQHLARDVDPNMLKRQARIDTSVRAGNSFASIAEELIAKKAREGLAEATLAKQRWLLKLLGAEFGRRAVTEITPQELLHELQEA